MRQRFELDIQNFLESGVCLSWSEEECLIGYGQREQHAGPQSAQISIYAPDFYLQSQRPWWSFSWSGFVKKTELLSGLQSWMNEQDLPRPSIRWQEPCHQEFEKVFADIKDRITQEELKKAVPVVFSRSSLKPTAVAKANALISVLKQGQALKLYGLWDDAGGIIGATPEILFRHKRGQVFSMALAGTRPTPSSGNLLEEPKEQHEHKLVADEIENRLRSFGEVKVSGPYEWNVGSLTHLRTDIHLKPARALGFMDLVNALHPTPALGVAPDTFNWKKLREWDPVDRLQFGAPFGVQLSDGESLCLVAIRNIQWRGQKTWLGSGCGIVRESVLEREWQELEAKRKSVQKALDL